ncbi:hypothetical protein [Clostridium sp.]|uniref:hypothetical protein n=1 Tax=Clostridium sp. TaxID=1506 RepID=UPI003F3943B8
MKILNETSSTENLLDEAYLNDYKNIWDNKYISFKSIRTILNVLFTCSYAFGLGYTIYYYQDGLFHFIKTFGLLYLTLLILNKVITTLFPILFLDSENTSLVYSFKKPIFDYKYLGSLSKVKLFLVLFLPFLLFTCVPTIISLVSGFNIFLYALSASSIIFTGVNAISFVILIFKHKEANNFCITNAETLVIKSEIASC